MSITTGDVSRAIGRSNLPSLSRCPNSVHYWQHNPCQRRILISDEARYIQIELKSCPIGPEPRLHDPEGGGLVDLGSRLQTLAHPQSARADVGVRKKQNREKTNNFNFFKSYDEPLFHAAKLTEEAPPFTDFALFLKKNSSLEEDLPMYTMYTGIIVFLKHSVLYGCLNLN